MVAAGAGHIPARGAGLETGEDGATFLGLLPESYKSSEMLFFSWLQKISLELPAVCSTKLAQTSETGFTCAPINWEVTRNL